MSLQDACKEMISIPCNAAQAEPTRATDAANRPPRKVISLAVDPSAQAAQWAARRTQKAAKAASAADVSGWSYCCLKHAAEGYDVNLHVLHQCYYADVGWHTPFSCYHSITCALMPH